MRLMASSPSMQSPRSRATRAGWRAKAGFSKASPASVSGLPCRLGGETREQRLSQSSTLSGGGRGYYNHQPNLPLGKLQR